MSRSVIASITIFAFLIASCGREYTQSFLGGPGTYTESSALDTLSQVPRSTDEPGIVSTPGEVSEVSSDNLEGVIEGLIASGQVKLPAQARRAVTAGGGVDLTTLSNLFALIQSGQATSVGGLATGLVNMNGGNATKTGFDINVLIQILTAVAPIVATAAPKLAPIVQALLVILPLIGMIISLFRKPKPAPTTPPQAGLWVPTHA